MAVFEELYDKSKRVEDPEARQAEKIVRKGEPKSLKRNSSGVRASTYRKSIFAIYWFTILFTAGVIGFLVYFTISRFVSN